MMYLICALWMIGVMLLGIGVMWALLIYNEKIRNYVLEEIYRIEEEEYE